MLEENLSLGQLLQSKRQELNIEIEQISSYLKIKISDIKAVEEERWEAVTKHIYKPGLIRSYAKMLKISQTQIEDKIKQLPFESNVKNKKYRLLNIGEETEITPNYDMFFNFLLISALLFLVLLAIYNAAEKKNNLLTSEILTQEMQKLRN